MNRHTRGAAAAVAIAGLCEGCTTCGSGTEQKGGVCVVTAAADTDLSGVHDTDVVVDTDGVLDTDLGDTDLPDTEAPFGPCAPPDPWTGDVPEALFTLAPYPTSYDAYLFRIASRTSASSHVGLLVLDATVVARIRIPNTSNPTWWTYLSDGLATMPMRTQERAQIGDKVSLSVTDLTSAAGLQQVEGVGNWYVTSHQNPVSVRAVRGAGVRYLDAYSQLSQLYGEITEPSTLDCGEGFLCFRVEHDARADLIRVPVVNTFGLDADYAGGLCAEVIAPVGTRQQASGDVDFLDVVSPTSMRTWPLP